MKTCAICKIEKVANEFEAQTTSDGLASSCMTCLQSARAKGMKKIPRGAICDTKRMSEAICNYDYSRVPKCYQPLIQEQQKLRVEMSRI